MSKPKITKVIATDVYPIVDKALKKNTKKYKDNIQKFIRNRAEDLYDTMPIKRMPFGEADNAMFFEAIDIKPVEITECLKNAYFWDMNFNPRAAKDEFTVTMMMVIRYFIMHNKASDSEISAIYLAFSGKFYPSIHSQKFPIPPEKYRSIMDYVLNNMTTKYDIKREGSVFGAVRSICRTWLKTYTPKFKDPDDEDVADMIQQLHGRIKSFLGNIASAYYDAYERKDMLLYSSDSSDDESFRVADNDSLIAERCTENTMVWITSRGVDYASCRRCCDENVTTDEVKSVIENIQADKDNLPKIRELIQSIIVAYFTVSKEKDVRSYEFIRISIQAKPNSHDKNVIRQRELILELLSENHPKFRTRRKRPATEQSYIKAVKIYYTLVINAANK